MHFLNFVSTDVEVHDCVPLVLVFVRLRSVDETFAIAGFWSDDRLIFKKDGGSLTAPVPEVPLDHREDEVLVLNGCEVRIATMTLINITLSMGETNCRDHPKQLSECLRPINGVSEFL